MFANGIAGNNNGYYTYGVSRPAAKNTQPLTAEQIQILRTKSDDFDMKVSQQDLWRAACTHKEKDTGASTLVFVGTEDVKDADNKVIRTKNMYRCNICGEVFEIPDYYSTVDVSNTLDDILSWLQICKTIYLDAPEEVITQYFQLIALLKKFMSLWKVSTRNFDKYTDDQGAYATPMSGGYGSGFNMLNTMIANPWAYCQQPMYTGAPMGMPMQPTQYNPVPYQQPQYTGNPMVQDPNANPLCYGYPQTAVAPAPVPGVMPATTAVPAPAPIAPAPAVMPATTAVPAVDGSEVQQQKTWNV